MDQSNSPKAGRQEERKAYIAPAIVFEHETEALAGVCNGSSVCPSKQQGATLCDSFEECTANNS